VARGLLPLPLREGVGGRGSPRMSRNGLTMLGLLAAAVVLVADQASKWWILEVLHLPEVGQIVLLPVLNLTMVWNRGVTFGLLNGFGQWSSVALAGVALAVVAALGVWLRRAESPLVAGALGTIAGGAVSNVIDRLRFGAVVDFIHAHVGGWSWYVFNLADAAIVCGVAALVLESLLPRARKSRSPEDASAG
jgi:signal peptidase II